MKQHIQLGIPTPCHENWSDMQPAEKGRHCAACAKTVIDFTAMSDTEIIRYMSQAGHNVCGRLTPGQMNRPLIPLTPPQKNKLPAWPLLVTSLLLTHDEPQHHRQPVPQEQQDRKTPPQQFDNSPAFMGMAFPKIVPDTTIVDTMSTNGVILGEIALTPPNDPDLSDSTKPDTVICPKREPPFVMGDTILYNLDSPKRTIIDTVKHFIFDSVSILSQKLSTISDTPNMPNTPSATSLKVYPNPVQRGSVFHLSCQAEPGNYHFRLFSSSGALIQERTLNISDTRQISEWETPANLPAGVYILRAIRQGHNDVYARQLVVQ